MTLKKKLVILIGLVFALTLLLNILVVAHQEEGGFSWHIMPGFYILLGFLGCIAFIVVAKWLGKHFLLQDEEYYEKR
jgi:hypothetical protein